MLFSYTQILFMHFKNNKINKQRQSLDMSNTRLQLMAGWQFHQ